MNKAVPMLRYQVDDLSCGHCVQAITQAVKAVDAGAEVRVDLATKTVDVTTQAEPDTVAHAIREAGYTPDAIAPKATAGGCCGHC